MRNYYIIVIVLFLTCLAWQVDAGPTADLMNYATSREVWQTREPESLLKHRQRITELLKREGVSADARAFGEYMLLSIDTRLGKATLQDYLNLESRLLPIDYSFPLSELQRDLFEQVRKAKEKGLKNDFATSGVQVLKAMYLRAEKANKKKCFLTRYQGLKQVGDFLTNSTIGEYEDGLYFYYKALDKLSKTGESEAEYYNQDRAGILYRILWIEPNLAIPTLDSILNAVELEPIACLWFGFTIDNYLARLSGEEREIFFKTWKEKLNNLPLKTKEKALCLNCLKAMKLRGTINLLHSEKIDCNDFDRMKEVSSLISDKYEKLWEVYTFGFKILQSLELPADFDPTDFSQIQTPERAIFKVGFVSCLLNGNFLLGRLTHSPQPTDEVFNRVSQILSNTLVIKQRFNESGIAFKDPFLLNMIINEAKSFLNKRELQKL
ncbi:hypothetical protein J7M23_06250 [Candidatus Sumerlaeota bacterium]|nr:hypothetical protein [Candidatus Sumerlaeota bacterium]